MKPSILPLAFFVILISSCTTAYKSGQTPDDVYFSPARPQEEYVDTDSKEEYRGQQDEYYDDHYLRMKVRHRYRWSDLDDPYYYRRAYGYNTYSCCYCKNPWTPSAYWNYYYNPYYSYNYGGYNPRTTVYTAPRKVNLAAYNPLPAIPNTKGGYTSPRYNTGSNNTYNAPRNTVTNTQDNNSGNILRSIFNSGNKNNTSSSTSNTSSGSSNNNSSSSSSSSSSSGSSGSSAPVRKF